MNATQLRIWLDRYKDEEDKEIEDTWRRIANWAAEAEEEDKREVWAKRFYDILEGHRFIPGGRITYAAGKGKNVTAMNCFVGPSPEDSREGIIASLLEEVETMSRGGGFGINMSSLRPRGARVEGVDGTSSGPVPWMQLFSTASRDVVQQGGTRRGALMLILEDWHPDVVEFINAKRKAGRLEGANISVGVSNAFMEAVEGDREWEFQWPKGTYHSSIKARELWEMIAESAHASGEPGIVFLDRCNDWSNLYYVEGQKIVCVNPCSEIPLPAYGSCLLGTINLSLLADGEGGFNWARLRYTTSIAVRLLDNVIDLAHYPLEGYEKHQKSVRQMAIGITGLADCLIKMGMRYGDRESVEFLNSIFEEISKAAYEASIDLAEEKGEFPLLDRRKFVEGEYVRRLPDYLKQGILDRGIRNAFLVGQQPSGTGSLLAGVNSGIEPVFSFATVRTDRTGTWEPESEAIRLYNEAIEENEGSLLWWQEHFFVEAHDLSPLDHIKMQAAAQEWCDQAISKTVNCPEGWGVEDVGKVFNEAWERGLKSVAVYRDKSRSEQVLHKGEVENGFGVEELVAVGCRSGTCDI